MFGQSHTMKAGMKMVIRLTDQERDLAAILLQFFQKKTENTGRVGINVCRTLVTQDDGV